MNSLTIGLISAGCIFGGVLLGMLLQKVLPEHHLDTPSKDTVKVGAGMLATLTALVLGLLVSSAKSSFDAMNAGIAQPSRPPLRESGLRKTPAREDCGPWNRLMQRRSFKVNCANSRQKTTCRNRFWRKPRRLAAMYCKLACF